MLKSPKTLKFSRLSFKEIDSFFALQKFLTSVFNNFSKILRQIECLTVSQS